jgi:hypothetical protein
LPGIRGARAGNRHALKHGRFTGEAKAVRAHIRQIVSAAQSVMAEASLSPI